MCASETDLLNSVLKLQNVIIELEILSGFLSFMPLIPFDVLNHSKEEEENETLNFLFSFFSYVG